MQVVDSARRDDKQRDEPGRFAEARSDGPDRRQNQQRAVVGGIEERLGTVQQVQDKLTADGHREHHPELSRSVGGDESPQPASE